MQDVHDQAGLDRNAGQATAASRASGIRDAADAPETDRLRRRLRREWATGSIMDIHPNDEMAIYSHGAVNQPGEDQRSLDSVKQNMRELGVIFAYQGIDLSSGIDVLDFAGGFGRLTEILCRLPVALTSSIATLSEAVQRVAHRLGVTKASCRQQTPTRSVTAVAMT